MVNVLINGAELQALARLRQDVVPDGAVAAHGYPQRGGGRGMVESGKEAA